jgi:stearoyl-CoA desaturase (delta-9 desaturase)
MSPVRGNGPIAANDPATRLHRRVAVVSVGAPMVGAVVAAALAVAHGVRPLEIGLFAVMYVLTTIGVEVGLHRFFSHHAFRAGPGVTAFLAITGSMAAQGPVLFWAAIHRKHHAFTDREGDPHSPHLQGAGAINRLRGLWHAHIGWLFAIEGANWNRYVPDLLRDRFVFMLNSYYPLWVLSGLLIPTAAGALLTGTWAGAGSGFLWGGLVRIFAVDHITWSVNSFGHLMGRRPERAEGQAGNIAWLSLPSFGGSWHNHHHAHPSSARNDRGFWQIDLAGWLIELLAVTGLAWNVRRIAERRRAAGEKVARALHGGES